MFTTILFTLTTVLTIIALARIIQLEIIKILADRREVTTDTATDEDGFDVGTAVSGLARQAARNGEEVAQCDVCQTIKMVDEEIHLINDAMWYCDDCYEIDYANHVGVAINRA